jgi:hypothetical protein
MEAGGSLDTSVNSTRLYEVTCHKTKLYTENVVRTSNPSNNEATYNEVSSSNYSDNTAGQIS